VLIVLIVLIVLKANKLSGSLLKRFS
jgi:hypothetical protein